MAIQAKRKTVSSAPQQTPTKLDQLKELRELPVPASLLKDLPSARWWFELLFAIQESYLPMLEVELNDAARRDHVSYARAFVVFYKLRDELNKIFSKDSEKRGTFHTLWDKHNNKLLPEALEGAGVTNVPLVEGIRVTASEQIRASIKSDQKDKAYAWLRQNGYGDLITTTVNASSLSSLAKELVSENQEFPEEYFNQYIQRGMSVTKAGSRKE